MKFSLKSFSIGLLVGLMVTPLAVSSMPSVENVQASLARDIGIRWNGEPFTPRERDGTVVHPIVYNGRTYLPVRYISERAGLDVAWSEAERAVHIADDDYDIPDSVSAGTIINQIKDRTGTRVDYVQIHDHFHRYSIDEPVINITGHHNETNLMTGRQTFTVPDGTSQISFYAVVHTVEWDHDTFALQLKGENRRNRDRVDIQYGEGVQHVTMDTSGDTDLQLTFRTTTASPAQRPPEAYLWGFQAQ